MAAEDSTPVTPQIGLVSHPNLTFVTENVNVTISLLGTHVAALYPSLILARVSGEEEAQRAVSVCRVGDRFIVRVKIPMSGYRYELKFATSSHSSPEVIYPHPLRYVIITSEACQNLLMSLEHPLAQKFGYAPVMYASQIHGISLIAPTTYRACLGYNYFLLHVDYAVMTAYLKEKEESPAARGTQTTLFSSRLMPGQEPQLDGKVQLKAQQPPCIVADLQRGLQQPLEPHCQDTGGEVHLDLSVHEGKYVLRLRQRSDFRELFEGLFRFGEEDIGSRVELFLRFPRANTAEYAPQKIGEWKICQNEQYPIGF